MLNTLDQYARRPFRYENIDGIGQLGIGILWMGIGALEVLQAVVSEGSIWRRRGTGLFCLLTFGAVVLYGMWALKRRITFRRTGYVKYRDLGKPWVGATIAAALGVPAGILSNFLFRHSSASLPVAVGCAGFALLYAFATRMAAAWNWAVLVVMMAGPMAISTLPLDRQWGQGPSIGFLGLTFFVSGAITLHLYLHRTRAPEEEAAE